MCIKKKLKGFKRKQPDSKLITFQLKRVCEVDNTTSTANKYQEKITWDKSKSFAICIGYNPAKAEDIIDVTNYRLMQLLSNSGYGGYYLFNLYSNITSTQKKLKSLNIQNSVSKKITDFIDNNLNNLPIVLFFGTGTYFQESFKKWLTSKINSTNKILITVNKKDKFTHPSRNAGIKLADLSVSKIISKTKKTSLYHIV